MKSRAEYAVVPKGKITVDEYRGDKVDGKTYTIIKTPQFGDPTEYTVCLSTIGDWCNCPGGANHGHCKHTQMVYKYLENQDEHD